MRRRDHEVLAIAILSLVTTLPGCGKNEEQSVPATTAAEPTGEPEPTAAPPQLAASDKLQRDKNLDSPRSHSAATIDIFGATPFASVLIGRDAVSIGGKVLAKTRCLKAGRPCGPRDAIGAVADVRVDIEPGELEAVDGAMRVRAVVKSARTLKDQPVAILADRRVTVAALGHVVASLQAAGARPVLAGVNGEGKAVIVAAQSPAGEVPARYKRAAEAKGLPEQVVGVDLFVRQDGSEAVLRPTDNPAADQRTRLHGDRRTAVTRWADRIARVYPGLRVVTAAFAPNAPWIDAIATVDMLRDRCGPGSTAAVCKQRSKRFDAVRIAQLPAAEAPSPEPPPITEPQVVEPHAIMKSLGGSLTDPRASLTPPSPIPHDLLRVPVRPPGTIETSPGVVPPHVGGPQPTP